MRILVIACEVFHREVCALAASAPHETDLRFLPKGLHGKGSSVMREHIQAAVDASADDGYDRIALAYGLCGTGLVGVRSRRVPLAIARAHDCIAVLLGSLKRHAEIVATRPDTYWQSVGWMERSAGTGLDQPTALGEMTKADMIAKYGEDNAEYLWEELVAKREQHYHRFGYISNGLGPDQRMLIEAQKIADARGWSTDRIDGDLAWLRRLVHGEWDHPDILVLAPGEAIQHSADERVMTGVA